jgi:hypothetical protein
MKRFRDSRHYSSAPTTQGQSLVGPNRVEGAWGHGWGLSGHHSGPCPFLGPSFPPTRTPFRFLPARSGGHAIL